MSRPGDPSAAQRRILTAASEAFAENGFGGTSTRDIAVRAGRSPAVVYIHYESKEALLYAISREGHADALACLKEAYSQSDDPLERLHDMVFAFSQWHLDNATLARVVQYELHALTPPHKNQIVRRRREFGKLMVNALRSGIEAGEMKIDNLDGTARVLLSLCIDVVRWFDPAQSRDPKVIAQLNADLALRIVGAQLDRTAP